MSNDVLIVEDEKVLSDLLKINLSLRGIKIDIAYTAQDGLDKALAEHPKVVILDVRLPDFCGWEVCKELKSGKIDSWEPVVIFLTAATQKNDKEMGKSCGGDEFLEKPFEMNQLIEVVRSYLA